MNFQVLERHLTINKGWKGSDHACSLQPEEFKEMISAIRNVETALGSPLKAMQPSEDTCYRKVCFLFTKWPVPLDPNVFIQANSNKWRIYIIN